MYDELVKRLRELQTITEHCDEQSCDECENRELCDKHDNKTLSGTYNEAAEAIEELSKVLDAVNDAHNEGYDVGYWAGRRDYEPKWIPMTERLPEDLTRVIVFCEDGVSFGLCEHLIADDEEVVEWHDFLHYPITPTHWMPLPQPSEEE